MFEPRINYLKSWGVILCFAVVLLGMRNLSAEIGLTSQPEPLGYPGSLDDPADALAEEEAGSIWAPPKRADDLQVPAGFDPVRSKGFSENPKDLLTCFQEPAPASCCDRNIVDRHWMGPGELAYHMAPDHKPCTRDYTRVFRTEFPGRLWFSTEYLVWATTGQAVPPLVTTSDAGTLGAEIGVIGLPTTRVLFGGTNFEGPMRSGARLTAGFWFTPQQERGIEASWFGLAIAKEAFSVSTNGATSFLARPYADATNPPQQAAVVIPLVDSSTLPATDPLLDQTVDASLESQFGSVNVLYKINRTQGEDFRRRYLVGGFRYLMLEDRLAVNMTSSVPTESATVSDSFRTLNQFYGGEFGMVEKWWRDRWSLQVLGKVALGATTVTTRINGSTTTADTATGTITTYPGGVLAQPTNPGNEQSLFAAAGEFGVTADYAIWSQFRLSVGYSLIYWTTVGRVTDQIDPSVNPEQFGGGTITTGPSDPSFNLSTTGFWAQGINAGLEYQF
ncbi:MAG: BBP7 family outer membrane beta-barrel protein [Pirellulales bacterium]|jgi:hypothetical protein